MTEPLEEESRDEQQQGNADDHPGSEIKMPLRHARLR